jgi:hypothetical protein
LIGLRRENPLEDDARTLAPTLLAEFRQRRCEIEPFRGTSSVQFQQQGQVPARARVTSDISSNMQRASAELA